MLRKKIKFAFINPPHADWSLANNMTYLICQSYYNHFGKYKDEVEWLPAPYKFDLYKDIEEIVDLLTSADVIMFSSYAWNYTICDDVAKIIKEKYPEKILLLGGPHIGTNEPDLLNKRTFYDYVCQPTKPGETFIQDVIDCIIEDRLSSENISWELNSKRGISAVFDVDYSVYEEHLDYLTEMVSYAKKYKLEPFVVIETTRGCPYKCVYCEWGGGIGTKIIKKDIELVKRDILALKKAGFRDAYLTDANFGAFEERDVAIFKFAWDHKFNLTDISTMKSKDLNRRKRLIDSISNIVGKGPEKHSVSEGGTDMWGNTEYISVIPAVSIQSVSEAAMKIADRVDLSLKDKLELSKYVNHMCSKEDYPIPAVELILGMPGSTLDDFYTEANILWDFKAWSSFRHDYMFLPDSRLNSKEYKEKYQIETVEVYSDIVDEDGTDNWHNLYKNKRTYFKTIKSCFSFTPEDMYEMWFMNNATNYLLKNIYPMLENYASPKEFAKEAYNVINTIEGFDDIYQEIVDILNPNTPPKSIRKLGDNFRAKTIEDFLVKNNIILKSEITKRLLIK
jgi:tRNA A37 methylthiotransferase MiaB